MRDAGGPRQGGRELKGLRVFAIAVLSSAALFCAVWAVVTLLRGHYLTTFVAVVGAVFALAPLRIWILMPHVVARGSVGAAGTVIRPDRRVDALMLVCLVAGTVGMGCFGVFGMMGKLDIPLPSEIARHYASIFIPPAVICLIALWLMALCRGIAYVRLTPDGFTFMEIFSAKRGEWSQVIDVTDEAPDRPQDKSPLVMHMANGEREILKESALYTPGGRALLELVRFYWEHPEDRAELSDGRALERLRNTQVAFGPGIF